MKLAEQILRAVNPVFAKVTPRKPMPGGPTGYSEAQYSWAQEDLNFFEGEIDLRGKIVLDAGCGHGGKTIYFAERGPQKIIGVDISQRNIDQALRFAQTTKRENVEFRVASLDALPFEAETFDLVLTTDVLEHVDRRLLPGALSEVKRVLKRDGTIAVCFPPWTSFDASHLYAKIHVPWCQFLFSDETILAALRQVWGGDEASAASQFAEYKELNRLTIEEFEELVRASGLRFRSRRYRMIKKLPRTGIMAVDQYLTKRVVAVLEK